MAARARLRTVVAQIRLAAFTPGRVVVGCAPAAIVALPSLPAGQRNVGAPRVIGLEDLPHDDAQVEDPSLFGRATDGGLSVSFTQGVSLHMRVDDIRRLRGRVRLQSPDFVRRCVADPVEREGNLEGTEFDPVECDRLGRDRERSGLQVDRQPAEFSLESIQVGEEIGEPYHGRPVRVRVQKVKI